MGDTKAQTEAPPSSARNHLPPHLRAPPCTNSSRGRSPFPSRIQALDLAEDSESELSSSQAPETRAERVRVVVEHQHAVPTTPPPAPEHSRPSKARRVSWRREAVPELFRPHTIATSSPQIPSLMPSPPPSPQQKHSPDPHRSSHHRRRHSPGDSMPNQAESSADETTAILSNERGRRGGTRRDYSSASTSNAQSSLRQSEHRLSQDDAAASQSPSSSASRARRGRNKKEKEGWMKRLSNKYGSVELENKGSVARDHLALERTFLAWLRTSLSFASIGIAVTQLFRLNRSLVPDQDDRNHPAAATLTNSPASLHHVGKPLGATFLAIGILVLAIGFNRYFESQHYVIMGKFPASRGSILVVSGVAGALIVASLAVILVVAPTR